VRLEKARSAAPFTASPVTIKDLFNVSGMPTRAGTRAPLPDLGLSQAPAVTRLREAGAVILGKTNMHEVALGVTGENPWTGDVKNPRDPARQAAARAAARRRRWRLGSDSPRSARTRAARSASRPPTAASWASSRPTASCRSRGRCPSAQPVTTPGRSPGRWTTRGWCRGALGRDSRGPAAGRAARPAPRGAAGHLDGALGSEVRAAFEDLLGRLSKAGPRSWTWGRSTSSSRRSPTRRSCGRRRPTSTGWRWTAPRTASRSPPGGPSPWALLLVRGSTWRPGG
jgi:hypothetical protein